MASRAKEKPKAIPSPEELLQGCTADKPFTSLQDYCRLLSQQEVVQATPVVTEEALPWGNVQEGYGCFLSQRCCSHSHQKLIITGHLAGHVQGALLTVPAQCSTAGLEELTLSKDSKRTGNFSWLFTDKVI